MELIDNKSKTLKDDLIAELRNGSKVSIAASCFSIYAFEELKEQLKNISELRFIFTSPTFVTDKIISQIAALQKKMANEKQPRRKRDLFQQISTLQSQMP